MTPAHTADKNQLLSFKRKTINKLFEADDREAKRVAAESSPTAKKLLDALGGRPGTFLLEGGHRRRAFFLSFITSRLPIHVPGSGASSKPWSERPKIKTTCPACMVPADGHHIFCSCPFLTTSHTHRTVPSLLQAVVEDAAASLSSNRLWETSGEVSDM
mmetsp:Transcript_3476/g.6765  ORF Transcript_3476/g.6765 Transcript_3476/m.6765 type:complete len:159 (-) Transcript_3476:20-496(-)